VAYAGIGRSFALSLRFMFIFIFFTGGK